MSRDTETPAGPAEQTSVDRELAEMFEAAYDENGVDRSLIRWSLSLTPTERVRSVEETLSALATLHRLGDF